MGNIVLTSKGNVVIDKIIEKLQLVPSTLSVLFIPTAANKYTDKSFIFEEKEKLIEKGFNLIECDLSEIKNEQLEDVCKKIDIVYVCGGNTFYLMQEVHKSGFDKIFKKLLEAGITYIGSSAGSAILGPTIEYVKYFDDPTMATDLRSRKGLSLFNFLLVPHFNEKSIKDKFEKIEKEFEGFKFLKITDDEFVIKSYP